MVLLFWNTKSIYLPDMILEKIIKDLKNINNSKNDIEVVKRIHKMDFIEIEGFKDLINNKINNLDKNSKRYKVAGNILTLLSERDKIIFTELNKELELATNILRYLVIKNKKTEK